MRSGDVVTPGRTVFRLLSPGGRSARLSVLIFHRVLSEPDPLQPFEPTAEVFEAQLRWVAEWFNVLPLADAIDRLARSALPERALAITFDDGYADNARVAAPILRRLGLQATFFVATDYLDGGRMWNDTIIEAVRVAHGAALDLRALDLGLHSIATPAERRGAIRTLINALKYREPSQRSAAVRRLAEAAGSSLPDDLMMSAAEVRALHRTGMAIGAHTASHPILGELSRDAARFEIEAGRLALHDIIGERVQLFAYPNGKPHVDYSVETVAIVKELGFRGAVSTAAGAARSGGDVFQVPRFTPWDRDRTRYGLRLAWNLAAKQPAAV